MTSGFRRPRRAGRRWLWRRPCRPRNRLRFGGNDMRRTLVMLGVVALVRAADFHPVIPRTWDDAAMATLELPNARPKYSLRFVSADYYYRIPVRPVYRTYLVYPI